MNIEPTAGEVAQRGAIEPANVTRWPRWAIVARRIIPFSLINASVLLVFFVSFAWWLPVAAFLSYVFLLIGAGGWLHRYFSHRVFTTTRAFQTVLAVWGGFAAQRSALWWASNHRQHHAYSDHVGDPHSVRLQGFWYSHMGWIFADSSQDTNVKWVRDLCRYPELRFLDRWYWLPPIVYWLLVACAGYWYGTATRQDPWAWCSAFVVWIAIIGTVVAWQATCCIASVTHVFGWKRYQTNDDARNSFLLNLFLWGEGWHNNHHYYQHSANCGFYWWEIDPLYYLICLLGKLGLVWDIKTASKRVIEEPIQKALPRDARPGEGLDH